MLVDGQVQVCNSFVFLDRGWRENRPPHLKGNISSPIKFINYAMCPENKTGKYFSTFHHQKFHAEIVFVAWLRDLSWEVKIVFLFFKKTPPESSLSFCHLICLFFDCKYHLHLPLFSLIVMAFPACTCEQVHIQHSFEFLCVVSGISV